MLIFDKLHNFLIVTIICALMGPLTDDDVCVNVWVWGKMIKLSQDIDQTKILWFHIELSMPHDFPFIIFGGNKLCSTDVDLYNLFKVYWCWWKFKTCSVFTWKTLIVLASGMCFLTRSWTLYNLQKTKEIPIVARKSTQKCPFITLKLCHWYQNSLSCLARVRWAVFLCFKTIGTQRLYIGVHQSEAQISRRLVLW